MLDLEEGILEIFVEAQARASTETGLSELVAFIGWHVDKKARVWPTGRPRTVKKQEPKPARPRVSCEEWQRRKTARNARWKRRVDAELKAMRAKRRLADAA